MMTTIAPGTRMTADELLHLPDDRSGTRYELACGLLVCMSPSSIRSNTIAIRIVRRVGNFVEQHHLGETGGSEGGFLLRSNPDTVRAPDGWFLRAELIPPGGMPDGFWPGAPDLAIEVLSPSNRMSEIWQRVADYLDAGSRLVWVVDPYTQAAVVLRPSGLPSLVSGDDALDGENVIPGFLLPLADVFS
jgi:Uma2 family endonuclease